jgi:NSS family neurotransmitter:Na+ symporter
VVADRRRSLALDGSPTAIGRRSRRPWRSPRFLRRAGPQIVAGGAFRACFVAPIDLPLPAVRRTAAKRALRWRRVSTFLYRRPHRPSPIGQPRPHLSGAGGLLRLARSAADRRAFAPRRDPGRSPVGGGSTRSSRQAPGQGAQIAASLRNRKQTPDNSMLRGNMTKIDRDGFTTNLGVLVATLGSAVGLGNIWKFPSLTGTNGGAGFLLVYLAATMLVGLPVMIAETMLGRTARADAVTSFEILAPRGQWEWKAIGWMGCAAALLIMAFYSEVAGWVYAYVFKAVSGEVSTVDPKVAGAAFAKLVSSPLTVLAWQWVVLAVTGGVIMCGVSKGIEAVTLRLVPLLFILLVALCVRSLTLDGAGRGLGFLFQPDFAKITPAVALTALGLAFFKLSLGMGTMLTYGSYFRDDQNIPWTATRVMLADLSVSLLAGVAIFPAVFTFGFEPAAGPSLVFMTIPAVFASMPGGTVFMTIFFLITAIASVGAILSLIEVPVAVLSERYGLGRKQAALATIAAIALLGVPASLSQSLMAHVAIFGLNPFDLFDFASSNVLLPLGGILICLFVSWVYGFDKTARSLSNHGELNNRGLIKAVFFLIRFIAPLSIAIVLLNGLKLI